MDDEIFNSAAPGQEWTQCAAPTAAGAAEPGGTGAEEHEAARATGEPGLSRHRTSRARAAAVTAAVVALSGGVGAAFGVGLAGGSGASAATAGSTGGSAAVQVPSATETSGRTLSVAAVAARVDPAVVDINTVVASPSQSGQASAAGTGMIVTSSGEILTNNHVVRDAMSIKVTVQGRGTFAAKVIGVDPTSDVALLRLVGVKGALPTVQLASSSSVAVGTSVVAIGNALGLGHQPTVVTGTITAIGRTITAADQGSTANTETLHNMLQTDANIVPGDSGGPLVNTAGQVIGMDTAASSSEAGATLGFAIPINTAVSLVDQMARGQVTTGIILGESPYLGIFGSAAPSASSGYPGYGYGYGGSNYGFAPTGGTGSGATGAASGVYVSDVSLGGPAARAGLLPGDTITGLSGKPTPDLTALENVLGALKPGEKVSVSFVDQTGASQTGTVVIGAIPK